MDLNTGKLFLSLLFFIFLLGGIYAQCNSTQIDINSANASRLDDIYSIGPAKADNIISYREIQKFNSLDDLINVSGIGAVTLEEIKNQGLACISIKISNPIQNSSDNSSNISSASAGENNNATSGATGNSNKVEEIKNTNFQNTATPKREEITSKVIALNAKSNITKEKIGVKLGIKENWSIYSLISFGIVTGLLFLFKKGKIKRYKSEFN